MGQPRRSVLNTRQPQSGKVAHPALQPDVPAGPEQTLRRAYPFPPASVQPKRPSAPTTCKGSWHLTTGCFLSTTSSTGLVQPVCGSATSGNGQRLRQLHTGGDLQSVGMPAGGSFGVSAISGKPRLEGVCPSRCEHSLLAGAPAPPSASSVSVGSRPAPVNLEIREAGRRVR